MAPRRISRGSPALLTRAEQEAYVRFLENHPAVAKVVEKLVGRPLSEMSFQERVEALYEFQEAGRAAWTLHGAYRGHRALELDAQGEDESQISSSERVMRAELEVDEVSQQLIAAKREADNLRQQLARERREHGSN